VTFWGSGVVKGVEFVTGGGAEVGAFMVEAFVAGSEAAVLLPPAGGVGVGAGVGVVVDGSPTTASGGALHKHVTGSAASSHSRIGKHGSTHA